MPYHPTHVTTSHRHGDPTRPARRSRSRRAARLATAAATVLTAVGGLAAGTQAGAATLPRPQTDHATHKLTGPLGPEGIPQENGTLLAPQTTSATGRTVDGIKCQSREQVAYHIHTHLGVYVDGVLRPVPAGVGLVSSAVAQQTPEGPFYGATHCYYWLHVHAQDGIIHIESPTAKRYTLGQFFDIWGQPLSTTQVGSATGTVTAYVDGRHYRGNPRAIALGSHEDVQIDVGTPVVPPKKVNWSGTGL